MKRKYLLGTVSALLTAVILIAAILGNQSRHQARIMESATAPNAASQASAPSTSATGSAINQRERHLSDTAALTMPTEKATASQLLQLPHMQPGNAETRLIEIFALVERAQISEALEKSNTLIRDHPNFHLAQLVHGDLMRLRYQPHVATTLGNVSQEQEQAAAAQLAALRKETAQRLGALQNRPPEGSIPSQFVALSDWTRHAIAIDASQSRLYLFENKPVHGHPSGQATQLTLIADFFISVGKAGIGKLLEGDNRTPLGVYYITSVKERKTLPPFYGAGALPINYPNAFDVRFGRTGSGIWLHGTPPDQFVRATLASEGCVVLSNPDLQTLLDTVTPRTTPVVISERLHWVKPDVLSKDHLAFENMLSNWLRQQRPHANTKANPPNGSMGSAEMGFTRLSLIQTHAPEAGMVVTFEETRNGTRTGQTRRQYWLENNGRWDLLQDTVLPGQATLAQSTLPEGVRIGKTQPTSQVATLTTPASGAPERARKAEKAEAPDKTSSPRSADEAIRAALQAWAQAWSQKNMPTYLKAYDTTFAAPDGLTRKNWEAERKSRIVSKGKIQVSLSNIKIQAQGNTATVRFVQNYRADTLNVSSRKTLKMIQRGNQWLITHEQVGAN